MLGSQGAGGGFSRGARICTIGCVSIASIIDEAAQSAQVGFETMNRMAAAGESFLFIIDAWARRSVVLRLGEARSLGIRWWMEGSGACCEARGAAPPVNRFESTAVERSRYAAGFRIIREAQLKGETWLANLTFPSALNTSLGLEDFAAFACAPFRLYVPGSFAVFSPERFVRIDSSGRIFSYPMKGTIDAAVPDAAAKILGDEKEAAEHVTIVDLIRNDIGMAARRVAVPRFRFITPVVSAQRRLLQVSSEVTGELGEGWRARAGEILQRLLPAGSVTGAPKRRTSRIIRRAEMCGRGWYAGVFGCFNGRELDSAVSIRFVEQRESGALVYRSGGGITIDSDMEKEYAEMQAKVYVPFA